MPAGVEVLVQPDGFAVIDFVDPSKRGPGLAKLLEVKGPWGVEKLSRSVPRVLYRVPEGVARAAGLLDKRNKVNSLEAPDTSSATNAVGSTPPSGEFVDYPTHSRNV